MASTYTHYLSGVTTVTIPATEHQLRVIQIQAVLYVEDPATGRFLLTPGLVRECQYGPPDFCVHLAFTRPVTGYLFLHEHPDVKLAYAYNRLQHQREFP